MARRPSDKTMQILRLFMAEPGRWHYGYDLTKHLSIPSGTLYPILMRLSDRGYLETKWVESEIRGRPPRHMYRLTEDGSVWSATEMARASVPAASVELRPA